MRKKIIMAKKKQKKTKPKFLARLATSLAILKTLCKVLKPYLIQSNRWFERRR
jgi:hypothetical protein